MAALISSLQNAFAPGARVSIRDEEWLIRRIDRTSSGAAVLEVVGLSPLVEGKEARFIDFIERENGEIHIVDPRETKAVADASQFYSESRLVLESQIRASTPENNSLHLGHRGAMDVMPYQLEPTTLALNQPRQRILIADAVGLGKTIECGVLLSEQIKRGRGRRILVVTVKAMLTQFQKELWSRFTIPLTRLDSTGLQSVRRQIPSNHNPFHYFDKTIISIDTLKQDGEYRTHLENAWWDIIVIDEAHNVAERGTSQGENSLRSRTAKLLASRSDALILLSATPHDGKRESFASLMNMLNPTAIKNPKDYGPEDIDGLFIRRFKKDVKDQISENFPERVVLTPKAPATAREEAAYEHLAAMRFISMEETRSGGKILFRTLLEKTLFSSPAACISTVKERIKRLEKKATPEADADIQELTSLLVTLGQITLTAFSKFQNLLGLLSPKSPTSIGWHPNDESDRIVIFTERIDTLKFLQDHLPAALKLKPDQISILHGGLSDIEQQKAVEAFGSADSPKVSPPPTTTSARKRRLTNAPFRKNMTITKPGSLKPWKLKTAPPSAFSPSSGISIHNAPIINLFISSIQHFSISDFTLHVLHAALHHHPSYSLACREKFIHPFADGNGRIGRLWQTLILSHWNPLFAYLPVETVIRDKQPDYYKVFANSDKAGNSTAFIEFLLSTLLIALREALSTDQVSDQVTGQVESLLRTLGQETLSAVECMKHLKLSHRPTFRANYLNPALAAGFIEYTIPETPQSRLQKYRISEKGRRLMDSMK